MPLTGCNGGGVRSTPLWRLGWCGESGTSSPLVQAHRAPGWIAWIYNNTHGSVFSAVLTHAADNLSWMLFPNLGSHYDPRIISPIIAAGALVVIAAWGPRTLTRGRRGSEPPL